MPPLLCIDGSRIDEVGFEFGAGEPPASTASISEAGPEAEKRALGRSHSTASSARGVWLGEPPSSEDPELVHLKALAESLAALGAERAVRTDFHHKYYLPARRRHKSSPVAQHSCASTDASAFGSATETAVASIAALELEIAAVEDQASQLRPIRQSSRASFGAAAFEFPTAVSTASDLSAAPSGAARSPGHVYPAQPKQLLTTRDAGAGHAVGRPTFKRAAVVDGEPLRPALRRFVSPMRGSQNLNANNPAMGAPTR